MAVPPRPNQRPSQGEEEGQRASSLRQRQLKECQNSRRVRGAGEKREGEEMNVRRQIKENRRDEMK